MGSVEKVIYPDGSFELRRYVAGTLITTRYGSGGIRQDSTNRYLLKDHLGSIDVIIDQHGNVVGDSCNTPSQTMSFDPWGQRRNTDTWVPLTPSLLAISPYRVRCLPPKLGRSMIEAGPRYI